PAAATAPASVPETTVPAAERARPGKPARPARPAAAPDPAGDTSGDAEETAVLDRPEIAPDPVAPPPDLDVVDPLDAAAAGLDQPRPRSRPKASARSAEARAARSAARARRREEKAARTFDPGERLVATLPPLKPFYAAAITGALAGLAAVLLAVGASAGCEAVRDTSTCGGGLGLLALVAILAIEVLLGANLLKAWKISDPFSTSFLGVGLVAIVAMLTFLESLDSLWMLLVIPVITAAAFVLSWWVTVRIIDEHPMASEIDAERGEPDFAEKPESDPVEDPKA
ncbi:MAG TPA: hypothetical protein VGE14_15350, partial [Marmoricola sp.]